MKKRIKDIAVAARTQSDSVKTQEVFSHSLSPERVSENLNLIFSFADQEDLKLSPEVVRQTFIEAVMSIFTKAGRREGSVWRAEKRINDRLSLRLQLSPVLQHHKDANFLENIYQDSYEYGKKWGHLALMLVDEKEAKVVVESTIPVNNLNSEPEILALKFTDLRDSANLTRASGHMLLEPDRNYRTPKHIQELNSQFLGLFRAHEKQGFKLKEVVDRDVEFFMQKLRHGARWIAGNILQWFEEGKVCLPEDVPSVKSLDKSPSE